MKTCTDIYTAETCITGYIELSKTCVKCGEGDKICTPKRATSCNTGYFLNDGVCTTCNPNSNVDSCYSGASSEATGCNTNYYLSSGACSQCASNTA